MPTWATVPAMPNAHSHAFQRGLRGRAERLSPDRADDFWTWRTEMFKLAGSARPAGDVRAGARTFVEMVQAGYGAVGEFHYVHHQPDGTPYPDRNEMAIAVAEAALVAGLEIVLLPAAYHRNGWDGGDRAAGGGTAPVLRPRRGDVPEPGRRAANVGVGAGRNLRRRRGAQRACGAVAWLGAIAEYSEKHGLVRHVHAHEQQRELEECQAEYGCSPIELLLRSGFLGPLATRDPRHPRGGAGRRAARAHGDDRGLVPHHRGESRRRLPAGHELSRAGVPLAIGSDSQVRIDPFEEARELETLSRRERQLRAGLLAAVGDLWQVLCDNGYRSLGLTGEPAAGRTVDVDLDHPDLRGIDPDDLRLALVTCASAGVVNAATR